MKKILTFMIAVLLAATFVQGQTSAPSLGYRPASYYTFSWNTTFPIGDFHDWVSQPSPAGFDFGGRYMIQKGLFAGFNFGWYRVQKEYDKTTYTIPDQGIAITATNYRFTWMVPWQAVIGYHIHPESMISPYVSLGIGGDYMEHHLMVQEYDIYKTRWDFSLEPEIGAIAKFGNFSNWGAVLAGNYKWTTNKIELYQKTSSNLSMFNIKLGLVYIIR
jgi:opacity protein-like surface antigen